MQMLGVLGWTFDAVQNLTLRQVTDAYDAKILNEWDQTASVLCSLSNLSGIVVGYISGKRMTPKSVFDFHPYRTRKKKGMFIKPEDIGVLRMIGNAATAGR